MRRAYAFPYEAETGRIIRQETGTLDEFLERYTPAEAVISISRRTAAFNDSTHYVDSGQLVERPGMELAVDETTIVADGIDMAVITGIPVGAICFVGSVPSDPIDDGTLEFTAEVAGEYQLVFSLFPYVDTVIVVTAT